MVRDWFRSGGFDKLTPFIAAFRPQLKNSLEKHTEQVYSEMIDNWEKGQDAQGRAWEPNAESTLAQKPGSTPLIAYRQMIDSTDWKVDDKDLVAQIYVDDEPEKVLAHELGVPDQGIPKRPLLNPTGKLFEEEADGIVGTAVDRSWAGASLTGTTVNFGLGGGR